MSNGFDSTDVDAARLRRMLDDHEIHEILGRYVRGIDRMDRDLIRSCYHDDGTDQHGAFEGTADEFVDWVLDDLPRYSLTMHHLGQALIDHVAPGVAVVETYALAFHRAPEDQRENWITGFRYVDRFERRESVGWRIAERTVVGEWVRLDRLADQRRFPAEVPTGRRDRDDPIYQFLAAADGLNR